jgi:hypothetical protein
MINIYKQDNIFKKLKNLNPDAKPRFGVMSPQHMVEHLSYSTAMSTGRFPQKLYFSEEQAIYHKSLLLDPDAAFPANFKAPMLGDTPPPLSFADLPAALEKLKKELDKFSSFFEVNPDAMPVHPAMGPLNKEEWIVFHNRHYTHHFQQFGLL